MIHRVILVLLKKCSKFFMVWFRISCVLDNREKSHVNILYLSDSHLIITRSSRLGYKSWTDLWSRNLKLIFRVSIIKRLHRAVQFIEQIIEIYLKTKWVGIINYVGKFVCLVNEICRYFSLFFINFLIVSSHNNVIKNNDMTNICLIKLSN